MDIDKFNRISFLAEFGAYFEDDDRPIEEIFLTIEHFIMSTQPRALHLSEADINKIGTALELCDDAELDYVLERNYGIYAHTVGGGRKFFQSLHNRMLVALKQKKSQTDP